MINTSNQPIDPEFDKFEDDDEDDIDKDELEDPTEDFPKL